MTINITPQITAAYETYLNESVDCDMNGRPILRRNTYPFDVCGEASALVDFAAGFQSGQQALLSGSAPQDVSNDPPFQF